MCIYKIRVHLNHQHVTTHKISPMLSMSWHKTQWFKTLYNKLPTRNNCTHVTFLTSAINHSAEQQNLGKITINWNRICRYPCIEVLNNPWGLIRFCNCCSTKSSEKLAQIHFNTNTNRQIHTTQTNKQTKKTVIQRRLSPGAQSQLSSVLLVPREQARSRRTDSHKYFDSTVASLQKHKPPLGWPALFKMNLRLLLFRVLFSRLNILYVSRTDVSSLEMNLDWPPLIPHPGFGFPFT